MAVDKFWFSEADNDYLDLSCPRSGNYVTVRQSLTAADFQTLRIKQHLLHIGPSRPTKDFKVYVKGEVTRGPAPVALARGEDGTHRLM